ncbi:hypothetical protein EOA16_24350 [Mesorhizobium sp. M7A.F.Ca.US.008.03.1.1]|nr:hypothetical protein EOA16_24350 [Mesorhizobium sp. M7A.F.Ca.US.008.03.1.1]
MRFCFLATAVGFLVYATAANPADKTVHDQVNGFSLTFPEGWINESLTDEEIRLSVKSADLNCMVSASIYIPSAQGSQSDTRKFMEGWSMHNWKRTIGSSFSTADFSNDRLARFPDGYPVRLADVDFTVRRESTTFYGHSRFAFSVRGARYGYVNCNVMAQSAEQVTQMWGPLADQAERVVSSFVLDTP